MRNSHIQSIISHQFGILAGGEIVTLFQLSNVNGMSVHILNYGGILQSIMMPDRNEIAADIVLGIDTLEDYVADTASHGAIVGRYANRIAEARFELDGQAYQLDKNDGEHCLHGGNSGFNKVLFDSEIVTTDTQESLRLRHVSPQWLPGFSWAA